MTDTSSPPRYMVFGTLVATLLAVIPAVLASTRSGVFVTAVSLLELVIATWGMWWAERRSAEALRVMLGIQFPLVAVVLVLTHGDGFLLTMPLASMSVIFLDARIAVASIAIQSVLFVAVVLHTYPPKTAIEASVGFISSLAFVAVFSRLMTSERRARSEVERLLRDLTRANQQLEVYVGEIEQLATARERNRIAREVHDGIGHTLTVASMQLEAHRAEGASGPRIERVQSILREGLAELRRSVSMLREGSELERPFPSAIAALVKDADQEESRVRLTTQGEPRKVSGAVGFTLYRAAQEALTNARKHASAKQIEVVLSFEKDTVTLKVEDDGVGAELLVRGSGLLGLSERVSAVGGTLQIDTQPGQGFRLGLTLSAPSEFVLERTSELP